MISNGITNGIPWTSFISNTEVIDLENNNVICKDLDDFPLEISDAVSANLASLPIICGGSSFNGSSYSSDKCFRYTEASWQHFAAMKDRRDGAAGIVYDNVFHIFGGYDRDESTWLLTSEIINEDGSSTTGPQLPERFYRGSITSINSTVSIIIGGYQDSTSISDQTWYFNHATQEFQPGPNLLEGRNGHSSGTITDQKTKEKIVIVAGGSGANSGNCNYMDSTEILLNGEWVTGKNHTESYICKFCVPLATSILFSFLES